MREAASPTLSEKSASTMFGGLGIMARLARLSNRTGYS